jgi:tRNA(His) 5'-end guanylyltransferase
MAGLGLTDRMKLYEQAAHYVLPRRLPLIIRVDGRAFHTYTKGLEKPVSRPFFEAMGDVAKALCQEVQGAQLAYIQSDEISILVHTYRRLSTTPWVDNDLQKIVSLTAGIASSAMTLKSESVFGHVKRAIFDSRAFVLPEAEVANYFVWRQKDAIRNSINGWGQHCFSQKQIHGTSTLELTEMCRQLGKPWESLPEWQQNGACCYHQDGIGWNFDEQLPIFTTDRHYVERYLAVAAEE